MNTEADGEIHDGSKPEVLRSLLVFLDVAVIYIALSGQLPEGKIFLLSQFGEAFAKLN